MKLLKWVSKTGTHISGIMDDATAEAMAEWSNRLFGPHGMIITVEEIHHGGQKGNEPELSERLEESEIGRG